jgi:hypothetical protein
MRIVLISAALPSPFLMKLWRVFFGKLNGNLKAIFFSS